MIERMGIETAKAQVEAEQMKLNQTRQDVMMQDIDRGMISEQLDVSEILNNMYYLLKGWVLVRTPNGMMGWEAPKDNDMVILSDHGVNYILGAVQWYVNKNTLLSNYEDEQILSKMEDFATTITDNVFMDYEHMFSFPTLEDCKKELESRIRKKIDIKIFAAKLAGITRNEEEVKKEILKEMEGRIEREMAIISQQKIKSKLKRFESIIRFVQDTVHSAYNRAWNGQERRTLREHIHITESKGGMNLMNNGKQEYTMNPLKMMGGRK